MNTIDMKNTFDGVNSKLDIAEENINELEGIAIETILRGTHREIKLNVKQRASVNSQTTEISLAHMLLEREEE